MFKYRQITDVLGRRILDGRGMPAIEVEVLSEDGEVGSVSVSLEVSEAHMEEMTEEIILLVNTTIADMMIGENLLAQNHLDQLLERMAGGTEAGRVRLGAVRAVSCAVARTASGSLGIPLYQYLGGIQVQGCPAVRICLPQEKEPEPRCQILIQKWRAQYGQTSVICGMREQDTEKIIESSQFVTVTRCLNEIRSWKKDGKGQIGLRDTDHTTDAFLVDLAVAAGVDFVELRPPVRGENTVKYTRIMRIQEHL